MNDAFISYSRRDKEFVQKLNEAFKQHQRQVWVDWEDIPLGAQWWQEIEKGIEQANAFVFTLSPDSIQSSVCQQEIEHAIKQHKRIIPIVYREVAPDQVHPQIAALNWIFFNRPENFEPSFQALLTTLDTDLEYVRAHTRLLNRAIEWEAKQRDPSFLLRGKELHESELWLSTPTKVPQPTALQTQYVVNSSQRQAKQQRVILTVIGIGFLITIALALFAQQQEHKATINHIVALDSLSNARLVTHDDLGSLLASMRAVKQVQHTSWLPPHLSQQVISTLREVLHDVQERNRLEGHTGSIRDMIYSPDGQLIVSTAADHTVKLWQSDGTLLFDQELGVNGWSVDFSSDGKAFAVALTNGQIHIWNVHCLLQYSVKNAQASERPLRDGQNSACQLKTLQQTGGAKAIIFTSDDRGLIVGTIQGAVINLWDINEETIRQVFQGHKDSIEDLSLSPDGQWLASASADNTVKIWRMSDGQLSQTLEEHEDRVYGVKFSPQGDLLASVSADNTMILWKKNGEQWSKQKSIEAHSNWVNVVNFSHDGQFIGTGSSDKTVKLWNTHGLLLKTILGHHADIFALSFTPDGNTIASAGGDGTIRLHSLEGRQIKILEGHRSGLKDVVFRPDGKILASVSTDKTVKFWSAQDGTLQKSEDLASGARKIAFSPNSQWFALANYNKNIEVWDNQGHLTVQWPVGSSIRSLAFSPDGQFIATAGAERVIKLWKLDGTLALIGDHQAHQSTINDINFSPDGQLLASASSDMTIKLWQRDGRLVKTLTGHQGWINSVNFSADGKYLVSASSDKTVKIWTRAGSLVRTLEGHTHWVWQAKFSPTDPIIASASADNTVKLWNLQGELLSTMEAHKNWVRALSFSPDGHKLATASADQTVILWDLSKEVREGHMEDTSMDDQLLLKRGCDWLHNYLKTNQTLTQDEKIMCD